MHRPIGRYRRSKQRKSMIFLTLVADTPVLQLIVNVTLILTLSPNSFCTNKAPFATENKSTANDVTRLRMSMISYVLNADSGR